MADGYSVKVNRRDGVVEVTGNDKAWVDEKLRELAPVWEQPIVDGGGSSGGKTTRRRRSRTTREPVESTAGDQEPPTRKRRKGGGGRRVPRDDELAAKLTTDVRKKLAAFVKERQVTFDDTQPKQAAIIAVFVRDNLNMASITPGELYTVYDVMGWRGPGKPRAALDNAKERDNFFSVTDGSYTLTHHGENFGRHDSLSKAE